MFMPAAEEAAGTAGIIKPEGGLGGGPRRRTRRSTATGAGGGGAMARGSAGGRDEEVRRRQRAVDSSPVLALPFVLPLVVLASMVGPFVPRKPRTRRYWLLPRNGWRPNKLPEEAPPAGAPDLDAAAGTTPAKKCSRCGTVQTPRWRVGPDGYTTLCNACAVWLRKSGVLRASARRRPPAPPTVPEPPPAAAAQGRRASDSPRDNPTLLARRTSLRPTRPPRRMESPPAPPAQGSSRASEAPSSVDNPIFLARRTSPRPPRRPESPPPAPAAHRAKKPASKKPYRPKKTGKKCVHCGSTSTPQWREGPMGRGTLCNACGVRYRQGRLLPEYRPAASPSFVPSVHANVHREVLQLRHKRNRPDKEQRRQQQQPEQHQHPQQQQQQHHGGGASDDLVDLSEIFVQVKPEYPPTPLHQPVPPESLVGLNNDDGSADNNALPGCTTANDAAEVASWLDPMLLDGPSAPPLVADDDYDDEFMN